ncbi:ribitol 5-phosphate transferase FKRP [Onthophagus taurus]|uniref:ribitol 5-phosphate transferase FKRP n=1 Tax=Onthophagus taurus TaxID=166361 RepID=UPI000C20E0F8|nr:fukutin-related protein-like [Onthophagus taurus]
MRIKPFGFLVVLVNIVLLYSTWRLFANFIIFSTPDKENSHITSKSNVQDLGDLVTIIIRDFQLDRNDVIPTIYSFTKIYPNVKVYVISDEAPYPPLEIDDNINMTNIKILSLKPSLSVSYKDKYPIFEIDTKYVLFLPDSTRLPHRDILEYILHETNKPNAILAIPVTYTDLKCFNVSHETKLWMVRLDMIKGYQCGLVSGKHATILNSGILNELPNALLAPFPLSLYLQTSYLNYSVKILQGVIFQDGKPPLENRHVQWMRRLEEEALKNLYRSFKIKLVKEDETEQWYGCTKNTSRCFPPVVSSLPSYLIEKKLTPPCCMSNLRKTALHVFKNLEDCGIRYWLEGGSLLGAMKHGDILPWDYDVDVGVNRDDLSRCVWLERAKFKPVVDLKGFYWEKAGEGNYFRVHYSKKNRIFVNIFPFYAKNGTMSLDGWNLNRKRMEFPDHFLHPMSSISFCGRNVPSPNNIRDFLELKFGRGSIENAQYPDLNVMHFP